MSRIALATLECKLGRGAYTLWRHLVELRGSEGRGFASQKIGGITRFLPEGEEWAGTEIYATVRLGQTRAKGPDGSRVFVTERARHAWRKLQRVGLLTHYRYDSPENRKAALAAAMERGDTDEYADIVMMHRYGYLWVPRGRVAGDVAIVPVETARMLEHASGHGGSRPGAGRPKKKGNQDAHAT